MNRGSKVERHEADLRSRGSLQMPFKQSTLSRLKRIFGGAGGAGGESLWRRPGSKDSRTLLGGRTRVEENVASDES